MTNSDLDNSSIDVKLNINESNHHPILYRALSIIPANQTLVNNQRKILAKNYRRTSTNDQIVTIDHDDADASFILPDLTELSDDIRRRIMSNLIDTATMTVLQETKRLNWWVNQKFSCPKLYPLMTSGDGNCLLHATSLAMWGFHDHALSMRKALNETLVTSKGNNSLYRRWRWTQSIQHRKYKLVYSEEEWNEEWEDLLRLSSIEPRISPKKSSESKKTCSNSEYNGQLYESLEEFHVYVLANNIRRPIIVYSERILRSKRGEAISPIDFGGIYLPLEIPPEKCYKQPVFLAFDAIHFSALVPMESKDNSNIRIPLIDLETLELLPIHFFNDPGFNFQWPIDEELSNETINLHSNTEQNQMNTLEKYLNLSKEYSSLSDILPSSTPTTEHNDRIPTIDLPNNNSLNYKKLSRSSLNAFSKAIRRKIFEPFSSTKRISFKHRHQYLSVINENSSQQQQCSPLLNPHTNILTIILVNFQPKQPKISDHMIKNYIETCISECHPKPIDDSHENLPTNTQSSVYCRHHQRNASANQTPTLTEDVLKKNHIESDVNGIPNKSSPSPTSISSSSNQNSYNQQERL